MMSRINNFSKMFLISESYYNDLKNKNGEEEQATTMEEIPIPPTDIISSPSPLINDNDGNVENDDDDDDDDDDDVGDNIENDNVDENKNEKINDNVDENKNEEVNEDDGENSKYSDGKYESIEDKIESFNCPICNEAFKTKEEMLSHQKKYHPVYECKLCSKSFRNQKARDNHITNLHEYSDKHLHLPSSSKTIKKYRKRGRPSKKIIKEYKGKITGEKNRGRKQSNKTEIKRGRGRPSKRLREEGDEEIPNRKRIKIENRKRKREEGVGEIHNAKKAKIENKKRKREEGVGEIPNAKKTKIQNKKRKREESEKEKMMFNKRSRRDLKRDEKLSNNNNKTKVTVQNQPDNEIKDIVECGRCTQTFKNLDEYLKHTH